MPDKHAVLSASSSHRWLACPPSALLCAKEKDKPSEFSLQGTDAHTLCEHKLKTGLGQQTKDPTEDLTFFDEEMADCTDMYAQYVMEQLSIAKEKCSDPIVLVEQHLDFSQWVPEGFGTGDCVIVADETLTVIDFKYGVGILVDAENNPQMLCYALGALSLFDGIYDIKNITMTIFQPRREHVSTFSISKEALLSWAEKTLAPTAQLAAKGEGEYKAGSHCQFCKVKSTCRKRAEYNLELARYDFEMLFIELPSGRRLSYVKPKMGVNKFGSESVVYEGVGGTKKWEQIESYGPKFVENIVQAISRDILAYAMRTLSHCFICGHVHDELIIECSEDVSLDAICEQMGRTPPWIPGLLLRADGYECDFYKKD